MTQAITIAAGKYLALRKRDRWEYVDRIGTPGAVVLVALTPDDELLLVEQYRAAVDHPVIELPAGLVADLDDPNESWESAAHRELLEETGYQAEALQLLTEGYPSCGITSEFMQMYFATGLTRIHDGGGDLWENITVHRVPCAHIQSWIREQHRRGVHVDIKVYAALYFVEQYRAKIATSV